MDDLWEALRDAGIVEDVAWQHLGSERVNAFVAAVESVQGPQGEREEEAYDNGWDEGHKCGKREGYQEGFEEGQDDGWNKGLSAGRNAALREMEGEK